MAFSIPKVTIDLDEYLDLKRRANNSSEEDVVDMAKFVIYTLIHSSPIEVAGVLTRKGISLSYPGNSYNTNSYKDIVIKKKDK